MNKVKFVLFTTGILLALGFVFGCSSGDGGNSGGNGSNTGLKECDAIFNPDNKFCYDGTVYDKCGGNSYNPTTQGCLKGQIVAEKCGTNLFNPDNKFCYDGTIYDKCGGNSYNPVTQGCVNGKFVDTKCGSVWYDQAIQTCCGSSFYNQRTQFCYNGVVSNKCDGMEYPLATHICQNGVAVPAKCDGESYNPLTQYCSNGTLNNYDIIVDARDGKRYKTVVIGSQTWMAENLNYNASGSRCCRDNNIGDDIDYGDIGCSCAIYGRIYNWATAMESCPESWHLPTADEWLVLIDLAGGWEVAGKYLKAMNGWNINGNGEDKFGFSALPAPIYSGNGGRYAGGEWWSASGCMGSYCAYGRRIIAVEVVNQEYDSKALLSVRCLQD